MSESETGDISLVRAAPVLLRLAASAWWRASGWTVEASMRASVRLLRAAASGESPAELMSNAEAELREYLRRLLGLAEPEREPEPEPEASRREETARNGRGDADSLRERGAELLRRSAGIAADEDEHPAYARILSEMAPDEARVLRLLALEGPQPAVDVRTGGPLGMLRSELVAPGLTMIGAQSGCRDTERVPAYLNNLYRLGLIWFSRESLDDIQRYQVLEAQPEVSAAIDEAGRAKTIRRSIHLTPFGKDFCDVCLPLDTAEIDALPASEDEARDRVRNRGGRSGAPPPQDA
jgi:hypothetical protein